jgi:hypothetical protein
MLKEIEKNTNKNFFCKAWRNFSMAHALSKKAQQGTGPGFPFSGIWSLPYLERAFEFEYKKKK